MGMTRCAKRIYNSPPTLLESTNKKNEQKKLLQKTWSQFAEAYVVNATAKTWFGQSWFATLTTQYTLTLPSARRAVQRFSDVAKRDGKKIVLCWFAERYELKDGYHLHALVSSDATRDELHLYWSTATRANKTHAMQIAHDNGITISDAIFASDNEPHLREVMNSRSNFVALRPGGKGGSYASKYITKGGHGIDYDIIF